MFLWLDLFGKMFMGHSNDAEVELVILGSGVYLLMFGALIILDLVFKALMLIDFIGVKRVIGRMTVRGR